MKRKGRLESAEKNKGSKKTIIIELTEEDEKKLQQYIYEIEELLRQEEIPPVLNNSKCKKCAYFEYCYI